MNFQFNTSVSGTKHIRKCDNPTDFFYLLFHQLSYLIGEHKQICKECSYKEMERCKFENHESFNVSFFQNGISQPDKP